MAQELPTEGFVWTVHKGTRTFHAALKFQDGSVGRYSKNGGEGMWCGKKVASTFFAYTWKNIDREALEARVHHIEELDRLMPPRSRWDYIKGYDCKMCGAIVHDRNVHLKFHYQPTMMFETVNSLFGETDEQDSSSDPD